MISHRLVLVLAASVGCGGVTNSGDDASVDAPTDVAIADAGAEAAQCMPYVVSSWDGGLGACDDGPCPVALGVGTGSGAYAICTVLCSDLQHCPKGLACDLPFQSAHEFECFPTCDDAGGCAAPLACGGYTTKNVCH